MDDEREGSNQTAHGYYWFLYTQLRNFELPANSDLHTSRHFPSSHNFSALADYMKYLDTAANVSLPKYRSETQYSLNPDLLLRSRVSLDTLIYVSFYCYISHV